MIYFLNTTKRSLQQEDVTRNLCIVIFLLLLPFSSQVFAQDFSKKVPFAITQDGLDINGTVRIDGRFIFNGAAYIRWEYSDLTIENVTNSSYESFSASDQGFPMVINKGGYKIGLDVGVYKGYDGGYSFCENDRDHGGIGTIFEVEVYTISDVSEVTAATSYYKNNNSTQFSDAKLWQECSEIRYIHLKSLSTNIIRMLKSQIDEIKREQKTKEEKEDGNNATGGGYSSEDEDENEKEVKKEVKKEENQEEEIQQKEEEKSSDEGSNDVKVSYQTQLYFDYMEKGRAAEARGDYQSAINYYQSAYNISPSPSLASKIQNLREWQGAAALVQTASLLSQIEVEQLGDYIGGGIGFYKSRETPTQRSLSLMFQQGGFNRVLAYSLNTGFSGNATRNIDAFFSPMLGLGIGTNYFGIYGSAGAKLGYRLKRYSEFSNEDRLVVDFNYGFQGYIKVGGGDYFINLMMIRSPGPDSEVASDMPGYVPGAWEFRIGIGISR